MTSGEVTWMTAIVYVGGDDIKVNVDGEGQMSLVDESLTYDIIVSS